MHRVHRQTAVTCAQEKTQDEDKADEPPKNGEAEPSHAKTESFDAGSYGFFGGATLARVSAK